MPPVLSFADEEIYDVTFMCLYNIIFSEKSAGVVEQ